MMMKSGVRSWEVLGVGALLFGFALYMTRWGMEGVIHSRKTQTVPDMKGRSLSAALDMLTPLNLGLRKEGAEFNNAVPVSSVLKQEPPAGTVVREGKIVRVVVSQGGETVLAPSIVGLPLRNAEMFLRQAQLLLGEVNESYSLRFEKGVVLSQEPKGEASVERNSLVNVSVSGGVPPAGIVLMPDFLRKSNSEAQAWASASGLTLHETKDLSSPFAFGTVLSQDPAPDTVVSAEGKVVVVISGKKGKASEDSPTAKTFHYELSQGGAESLVRVVVADKYGERELFNGLRRPGSKIDLPIQETGGSRVKIFINGILVEERDL